MSIRIGQASCGESGIAEQKPGDQTGRELNFAEWYHGTWLAVLRCCDERQAERAARACEAAVRNKNIGYCQSHRNTLFDAAKRAGWGYGGHLGKGRDGLLGADVLLHGGGGHP